MIDIEIPFAVAEQIASWRGVLAHCQSADARKLLHKAAAELYETLQVNKKTHPEAQAVAHIEVVDALQAMADSAGILPGDAQLIFKESFKARTNGDGREHKQGENKPNEAPRKFNAEELNAMIFAPVKYVAPGYIVEGLTLFAGKPKIGKSWLLLHVAIAVARGGFTLGLVKCLEGDVLYCALEDNPRRLQSRLTKLLGTEAWPPRLHFACEMPRLTAGGIDYLKKWIQAAKHPRLIIIDTLAMVRTPSTNRNQSMYDADYEAVKDLRTIASQFGIAIVLVHHLRKQEADDAFDTVSGTLGLTGAPDSILVVKRETTGNVVLHGRGRDLIEIEKVMTFNKETCVWTVAGDAHDIRVTSERAAILETLRDAGEPLGPGSIATAIGMKAGNVRRLLGKLVQLGTVKKQGFGKYALAEKETAK